MEKMDIFLVCFCYSMDKTANFSPTGLMQVGHILDRINFIDKFGT